MRVLLTASEEARLRRRSAELHGTVDDAAVEATRDQVVRRDRDDSTVSSFTEAAEGVVLVDTSDLDLDESVEAVLDVVAATRDPQKAGLRGLGELIAFGASPRATSASAARTFSAAATRFSTLGQTPSLVSAALPYSPAGTEAGSAIASLPVPSSLASGKFGPIATWAVLVFGTISTSALPSRFTRLLSSISLFLSR